ncbi:CATRA conflict system CASPASE/TPR repeat-associated protein [Micromonospora sp. WMMD1274]|uniref:CATRA conflict system CASPASE/TPR repeat-associated protein n=1 Tax=Micromonospora sp. WMMD1274 TaxID=3404116 RepID=UPI003B945830
MAASNLVEPEFVAHLFVPLSGPDASVALAGVRTLWENCRNQLGMTQPIVEAGLAAELPEEPANRPDGALAGLQDPAVRYQAIVRREHDVLNFSFAIAAPDAVPQARFRLAASVPPGWHEFTRWWDNLGAGAAALGAAIVYLAKTPDVTAVDLRAEVPRREDDADAWWEDGYSLSTFAAWEVTAAGVYGSRRLVLLAGLDQDVELSRFAWSDGGTALPPLARYLMHAAKLRYLARVLGDGQQLARLRERTDGHRDHVTRLLRDIERRRELARRSVEVSADEAEVAGALRELRQMRQSAQVARTNMARALTEPLPGDAELAEWLIDQLAVESELMDATREQAERFRLILGTPIPPEPEKPKPAEPEPTATESRVEHRVAFGIDVVSYSSRSVPVQKAVQDRLAGMVERVLTGVGLAVHQTDRQNSGDGMMVVLPASVPSHIALPKLLGGWLAVLADDNAAHPEDRIRVRLSIGSGLFTAAATGFAGLAIIEIGRVLDSQELRRAVAEHPDVDVVAGIGDRLYQDVVASGYPDLEPDDFQPLHVTVKSYRGRVWLWTGGLSRPPASESKRPASPSASRDVFVIHGPGHRPRNDVFELLRAIELHPLDWEELVARTGEPAPYRDDVLAAGFAAGPGVLVVLTAEDMSGGASDALTRAGRALALRPDRTVIAMIGPLASIDDFDGREVVRLGADTEEERRLFQHRIAQRLRIVGCPVDTSGTGWLDPERFAGLL